MTQTAIQAAEITLENLKPHIAAISRAMPKRRRIALIRESDLLLMEVQMLNDFIAAADQNGELI